ncbi:MAG: HAMP domain-containing sensor histidine kinase [Eubacteriales bacterium]|nr:HAMP domain-containing sensor histidine kinase [Eubacteriales bacterium]
MKRRSKKDPNAIKTSRFPISIFVVLLCALLLMSGVHVGIIVLGNKRMWPTGVQILLPTLYWSLTAVGLTLFTRWKISRHYEEPMRKLRDAAEKVANGDFSVYVAPLHIPGERDYLDAMIMDFNKMVEELGSMEVLKTDFFSNVSHEIKTPLAVIHNNAELLQREHLTEAQRKEYAETILHATRRLANLIGNMLRLNKLEKQAIQPTPSTFDLCAQLSECALQFEAVWERKEIDFVADLEDRAFISGDEELLALVWTNLISNAMKFTPPGGTVTLRQTSDADGVVVTVADTGCGMDRETVRHIFDKFYQGDTSHSTEGNGLGLALVRRILELSDGTIAVQSAPGQGSVFTVRLPASFHREESLS